MRIEAAGLLAGASVVYKELLALRCTWNAAAAGASVLSLSRAPALKHGMAAPNDTVSQRWRNLGKVQAVTDAATLATSVYVRGHASVSEGQ